MNDVGICDIALASTRGLLKCGHCDTATVHLLAKTAAKWITGR